MAKKSKEEYLRSILNHGERVMYRAKVHPSAYAVPVVLIVIGLVVEFVPEFLYHAMSGTGKISSISSEFITIANDMMFGLVIIAFGFGAIFQIYSQRKNNLDIITSHRVIHVSGTLIRKTHAIWLHNITNVKSRQCGFEKLMFRGRVYIRSSQKNDIIELPSVAAPKEFVEKIKIAIERFGKQTKSIEKDHKKNK